MQKSLEFYCTQICISQYPKMYIQLGENEYNCSRKCIFMLFWRKPSDADKKKAGQG